MRPPPRHWVAVRLRTTRVCGVGRFIVSVKTVRSRYAPRDRVHFYGRKMCFVYSKNRRRAERQCRITLAWFAPRNPCRDNIVIIFSSHGRHSFGRGFFFVTRRVPPHLWSVCLYVFGIRVSCRRATVSSRGGRARCTRTIKCAVKKLVQTIDYRFAKTRKK